MAVIDCTVVVSTFGSLNWKILAKDRAIPSAKSLGVPVVYNHGDSLHEARNLGLSQVETEYVCHLDADDELSPGFFEEIEKVEGDIRVPSINYVPYGTRMPNVVGHNHICEAKCLSDGNWIVVGAVARTDLVKKVGGWRDYPIFEDFDLWQRCWIAGASIVPVPTAVYKAYSTEKGRNKSLSVLQSRAIQRQICMTNLPDMNWDWLK